jgi:hypothetical protein
MIDGPNVYLYCLNNPTNVNDLWGLKVLLGQRPVKKIGNHTVIILQPDNEADFINDPRFYRNSQGKLESVVSAGPNKEGNLSKYPYNYQPDKSENLGNLQEVNDPRGRSDTDLINDILDSADKYDNSLPYQGLPLGKGKYNSNSFTSGILKDAGVESPPNLPGWQPGADKPIPISPSPGGPKK